MRASCYSQLAMILEAAMPPWAFAKLRCTCNGSYEITLIPALNSWDIASWNEFAPYAP